MRGGNGLSSSPWRGKRACPASSPPSRRSQGLFNCPTIVNNVKTLASVPWIIENGAKAYAAIGTPESAGTHLFGLSGHVNQTGIGNCPSDAHDGIHREIREGREGGP